MYITRAALKLQMNPVYNITEIVVKTGNKINQSHTFYMRRDSFCLYFCPYRLYDPSVPSDTTNIFIKKKNK